MNLSKHYFRDCTLNSSYNIWGADSQILEKTEANLFSCTVAKFAIE